MTNLELRPGYGEVRGPQEACGITGILSKNDEDVVAQNADMEKGLHHRGRDSAGVAVIDGNGRIIVYKRLGSAFQVFPDNFDFVGNGLIGRAAIGHNRYGTSGEAYKDDASGAQPMVAQWQDRKVAIAYNGNLPEKERLKLKDKLPKEIPESRFDTEDIAYAIVTADGDNWEERIKNALQDVNLAYSLTILTDKGEVFGLRCPVGTWPLWVGENSKEILFASENRVNKDPNVKWSEVKPGELVKATKDGVKRTQIFESKVEARCALHDVYGAKRDSLMTEEGLSYRDFSVRMGEILAEEHPIQADLYIGLPQSGTPIAEGYARMMGRQASQLIIADGERSFIARNGHETMKVISGKYSIEQPELINNKKVVVLDDSAIKGATLGGDPAKNVLGIVGMLEKAGAREVHIGLILPKFVNGCDMGYFIVKDSLVAVVKASDGDYRILDEKQIAEKIGADSIFFMTTTGVKKAYKEFFGREDMVCNACAGDPHPSNLIKDKLSIDKSRSIVTIS